MATIAAVRFAGQEAEAYIEAIRCNAAHGLPLSPAERRAAVGRLLMMCPDWSDRRIAQVCAVAARTVALVRAADVAPESSRSTPDPGQVRLGRDGRSRPREPSQLRENIRVALLAEPHAPLRLIASRVGASPETVRSVRRSIRSVEAVGSAQGMAGSRPCAADRPAELTKAPPERPIIRSDPIGDAISDADTWTRDRALTSHANGPAFVCWFTRSNVNTEWEEYVAFIPVSRLYEVADEAHRRAECWTNFARRIEDRTRSNQTC
jgi:hypothetical protein